MQGKPDSEDAPLPDHTRRLDPATLRFGDALHDVRRGQLRPIERSFLGPDEERGSLATVTIGREGRWGLRAQRGMPARTPSHAPSVSFNASIRGALGAVGDYVFPHIESPWSLIAFATVLASSLPANSSCMFGATALLKMSFQAVFTGSRTT
jgi:hypothetical protein